MTYHGGAALGNSHVSHPHRNFGAARIAPKAVIIPSKTLSEFEVVAVAARDGARAKTYAAEHDIPAVAADYAALIARPDVDLVYNALPPKGHLEWSIAALKAGKTVLCEKPFSLTAAEARVMVAASERTRRPLIEAFHYRFHGILKRALDIVRAGELGALVEAEAVFDAHIAQKPGELRWLAEQGGGALMDLGCYCVHSLRIFAGSEPQIVSAECDIENGVDVTTRAALRFPNGLQAKLQTTMKAEKHVSTFRLKGEKGSLSLSNFVQPAMGCILTITVGGKTFAEEAQGPSTYAAQLMHVGDVMRRGIKPLTGGQDAIATMECIEAIYAKAGFQRAL